MDLKSSPMRNSHFLPMKPASSEEVLNILRDMHRHAKSQGDLARHIRRLGKDTVVHDLNLAFNTGQTAAKIGVFFNETFDLNVASNDWEAVLEPVEKTPLWQACSFIAQRAVIPAVESVTVLGGKSRSTGAFLALRSIIWDLEGKELEIRPSTRLIDIHAGGPFSKLFLAFWKLAPAALPKLEYKSNSVLTTEKRRIRDKVVLAAKWAIWLALLMSTAALIVAAGASAGGHTLQQDGSIGGLWSLINFLLTSMLVLFGTGIVLGIIAMVISLRGLSSQLHYPKIETLGDLARHIAEQQQKRLAGHQKTQTSSE